MTEREDMGENRYSGNYNRDRLTKNRKRKRKQKFQTGGTKQIPEEKENQIAQNGLEYADDTQLLIEKDTHEQMCAGIGNYDISTETRELKIRWAKVGILSRAAKKAQETIHTPHLAR